jgi:Ser/Thr protein kinase RdoA (MazF antagonist)
MGFENLTPDAILAAIEEATGLRLTGLTSPLPSYINRVYELRSVEGEKLIAKFYRPLRWSREAIIDEHRFTLDCAEAEIPVVPPLTLKNGETVGTHDGIMFALFPKRAGRQFEINNDADWTRVGSLVARIHNAGARDRAPSRLTIGPRRSTRDDVDLLYRSVLPQKMRERFRSMAQQLIDASAPLFEGLDTIRIHGDCHRGNILDRLEEGLQIIDFDDMATGPAVQDLWLLLPDRVKNSQREIDLFLEGYERFRAFDRRSLRCIESLRAMRMIYFLGWCSRQRDDFIFKRNFPDWGTEVFWQREINDLREQLGFVMDAGTDDSGEGNSDY